MQFFVESQILFSGFLMFFRVDRLANFTEQAFQFHATREAIGPGGLNTFPSGYTDTFISVAFHILPLRLVILA
jgi:hypothetical protein